MLLTHPPSFIKKVYPSLEWDIKTDKKEVYITFDDGPTEGVTEEVLDLLKEYNAKATFFCVGKNIQQQANLMERIEKEGHTIGNHTYNHLNGWKTPTFEFVKDVQHFKELHQTSIFRPPYGRLKSGQIKILKNDFRIIMWSILTLDYSKKTTVEECIKIATSNWKKGSIIVFHDSIKAKNNMLPALRSVLEKCRRENWETGIIN